MKITDNRGIGDAVISWDDLICGKVYECTDGTVFLKTDENKYVQLVHMTEDDRTGTLWGEYDFSGSDRVFYELEVEVIIKGRK